MEEAMEFIFKRHYFPTNVDCSDWWTMSGGTAWGGELKGNCWGEVVKESVPQIVQNIHRKIQGQWAIQFTSLVLLTLMAAATVPPIPMTPPAKQMQKTFIKLMKFMYLGDGKGGQSAIRKGISDDIQSALHKAEANLDFLHIPKHQQANVESLLRALLKLETEREDKDGTCKTSMVDTAKVDAFVANLLNTLHPGCAGCDWCDKIHEVNRGLLGENPTNSERVKPPKPRSATHTQTGNGHGGIFGKRFRNLSEFVMVFAKPDGGPCSPQNLLYTFLNWLLPDNRHLFWGSIDTVSRRNDWENAPNGFVQSVMCFFNVAAFAMLGYIGTKTPWYDVQLESKPTKNCNEQMVCTLITQHKLWAARTQPLVVKHLSGAFIQIGYPFVWGVLYSLFVSMFWHTHPSQTISKFSASVSQASLRQPWNIIFQFWMRLYKTSLMFCTVVHCTACLFACQVWHLGYDIWNESFNQPLIAQHSAMLILGVMTFAEMIYFVRTVNEKRDISSSPTTKWQPTANVRLASIILTPLAWHHVIATYYPPNSWRPWLCVLFGAVFHFWLCGMRVCDRTMKAVWRGYWEDLPQKMRQRFVNFAFIPDLCYILLVSFIYNSSVLQIQAFEKPVFDGFCQDYFLTPSWYTDSLSWCVNIFYFASVLFGIGYFFGSTLASLATSIPLINKLCFDKSQLRLLCKFDSRFARGGAARTQELVELGHEYARQTFMPFGVPFVQVQAIICVCIICMHILFIAGSLLTRRNV